MADQTMADQTVADQTVADPVLKDLQLKYQPLLGKLFQGTFKGTLVVPETTDQRDIISVDPFASILSGVSRALVQDYGQQVWKGITGPEQSPNFPDYWLWVEPVFNTALDMGKSYTFQITQCSPSSSHGVNAFSHGVSITASVN